MKRFSKRIVALLCINTLACVSNISAQTKNGAIDVVRNFSQALTEYAKNRDKGISMSKFENLCNETISCRVENDLMKRMAHKSHSIPKIIDNYLFDTYINEIFNLIDNGGHITIENIEYDQELINLGLSGGKADYVKYDIITSEKLGTENRYTDVAEIRDGKLTALYQYSGVRTFTNAVKLLLPDVNMERLYSGYWVINMSKAEEAFSQFRIIASNSNGLIAIRSMEMMVSMEIAGIGCSQIGDYAKKMDTANYFVHYNSYLAIEIIGHNVYATQGVKYYRDKWHLCKQHPYVNDKGSAYFHYIFTKYRPLSNENLPYVKKEKKYYGFVTDKGKMIVESNYSFAYPFDNQSRLAAVRNESNKWGFINEFGELVIPHIYDIVNDVFVDGKNFVIKDDHLILIDKNGREIRSIYGYNYIIPKLNENEIIAYNGIEQQFDVYDFYGNLLLEDCFSSINMSKKEYLSYHQYFSNWGDITYNQRDEVNEGVFFIHRIPFEISLSDLSSEEAVDLGIGSLWASRNLKASSCSDMGKLYLWGDYKSEFTNLKRTSTNGKKYMKKMLKSNVPLNIAGTYWDIATLELGEGWHLPTEEDFKELIEECSWEYRILNGHTGYRIIGKNGNSIFIPIEGEFYYEPYDIDILRKKSIIQPVLYWSSELKSSKEPLGLLISEKKYLTNSIIDLSCWNYVRPVKKKTYKNSPKIRTN